MAKHNLVLTFKSIADLATYADAALPIDATVYKADGLDFPHGGGRNTWVVRREGDRPEEFALRSMKK